jgi:hypothetical protein
MRAVLCSTASSTALMTSEWLQGSCSWFCTSDLPENTLLHTAAFAVGLG